MALANSLSLDPYEKLADNVYLATSYYFAASRRFAMHNALSQWTIAFLSIGLIVIPLMGVCGIAVALTPSVVNCISIVLAIAVLVFSLLLGSNNYAVCSERMRQAGLALNELMRDMRFDASAPDRLARYQSYNRRYGDVLRHYPNDENIDYINAQIWRPGSPNATLKLRARYVLMLCREVSVYAVAILLESAFIVMMAR